MCPILTHYTFKCHNHINTSKIASTKASQSEVALRPSILAVWIYANVATLAADESDAAAATRSSAQKLCTACVIANSYLAWPLHVRKHLRFTTNMTMVSTHSCQASTLELGKFACNFSAILVRLARYQH